MLTRNRKTEERICLVVNNDLICVDEHVDTKHEEKVFQRKLNRAAKLAEKEKHHIDDHVFLVNNEFRFTTDH